MTCSIGLHDLSHDPLSEDTTDFANRTPESLDSLPKNATARRGRRGAVHIKKQEMEMVKGHKFVKKYFRKPIYCSHCHEMMWWVEG